MIINERVWNLLARKLSGDASPAELLEFDKFLSENPELTATIREIESTWHIDYKSAHHSSENDWASHLNFLHKNGVNFHEAEEPDSNYPKSKFGKLYKWIAAAAILIFITIGAWVFKNRSGADIGGTIAPEQNEISTKPGSRSKVQLPDGSTVWFNAGSKLNYKKDYGKEIREIEFSGEGYFDIVKMPDKPFIIHTKAIDLKVLGTAFNLKAYPEDQHTEASLIRGKIEVLVKNRPDDKPIVLMPSEKLIVENTPEKETPAKDAANGYNNRSSVIEVNKLKYNPADSTIEETLWINDILVIREESFKEVALKLERWYNVVIDIKNKKLEDEVFTMTFKDETIDQALEGLSYSTPFKFEKKGNRIIIY